MIKNMIDTERDAALAVADLMAAAAKTAPKGSGRDTVMTLVVTGEDKDHLRDKMIEMGKEYGEDWYERDAWNVDASHCVVIFACCTAPFGLDFCGMCGFENCGKMVKAGANCVFNITDLGIAVGSAVSVAANHRMDNRVLYSAGKAALLLGYFPEKTRIAYGVPLSTSSKSIFFDRNPEAISF